jgi:hypothetical protein
MARGAFALIMLAAVGCSGGTTPTSSHISPTSAAAVSPSQATSTTPSGSPLPAATPAGAALPLGIFVKDFLVAGGATYSVSLVNLDGKVVATATGAKRSTPVQMPNMSASNTRLYFLDGDSKLMFLKPDGTTGLVAALPVDKSSVGVFAVSPDDTRIAVSIITFPYPAHTRIYVEDLVGGGHHVELFSSGTVIEWPVGWHQGHLVIAVGLNVHPQNLYEGFLYGLAGYHVADAATGLRIATVCDGYSATGPPVPAGTVCVNYPSYKASDWTGATRVIIGDDGCGGGVLSPDGSLIADCQGAARNVGLVGPGNSNQVTRFVATPLGWMDDTHVVISGTNGVMSVLDVQALSTVPIQAQGFFAGTIPGAL